VESPADPKLQGLTGAAAVPRKNGELVFDAPWQSRAFGMAVGLAERGLFRWDDFRDRLIAQIAATPADDPVDSPATVYYRQWLAALEAVLGEKGLLSDLDVDARAEEFASGERDEVF
jgi:nitrile hydratase accessory protein